MSGSNMFSQRLGEPVKQETHIGALMSGLESALNTRTLVTSEAAKLVVSTENLRVDESQLLANTTRSVDTTIQSVLENLSIRVSPHQVAAGTAAAIIAASPRAFMNYKPAANHAVRQLRFPTADGSFERGVSLEAYDERANKNAQLWSITYNISSSIQDAFSEAWFPTIVVSPDQVGIVIEINLLKVLNDVKRSINGAVTDFGFKNVTRAFVDPTIFKGEQTRIVPVLYTGGPNDNTGFFAAAADIAPYAYNLEGEMINTSYLKPGATIDLIGISQTQALLDGGVMDVTDALDSYIALNNVAIKVTDGLDSDVIKFSVADSPTSIFTYTQTGNTRDMMLSFNNSGNFITPTTTKLSGGALVALNEVAANNYTVRVKLNITAATNLQKAKLDLFANSVSVVSIQDVNGNLLDMTAGVPLAVTTLINAASVIGYELTSYRANSNRRQRGQLMDTQTEVQVINVPWRSPISILKPPGDDGQNDSFSIGALAAGTHARMMNDAVTRLFKADTTLASLSPFADYSDEGPDIMGTGRYHVIPTYFTENIVMTGIVDSLRSQDRIKDIRAALVEKIRYYVYQAHRMSQYSSASIVLEGVQASKPKVVIGCDEVLANYLNVEGDLRNLGEGFECVIVAHPDIRMRGHIFISFVVDDGRKNTQINPLSFGNLLWSPEITYIMPISRNNTISKELTVTPRYLHIVNLPILIKLVVTGLSDVLDKVAVDMVP